MENKNEKINYKEEILNLFSGKKINHVIWQPRIMLWYNGNQVGIKNPRPLSKNAHLKIAIEKREQYVPKEWIGLNPVEIHQEINSSIRYTPETMNIGFFYSNSKKDSKIIRKTIKIDEKEGSDEYITKITTPVGILTERTKGGYKIEKMIKKPEDIKIAKYIIENTEFGYNPFMYEAAVEELENMGVPQTYYFRSPYQRCVLEFMGFEKTTIWLRRKPEIMEDFMNFLEEWDKNAYQTILKSDLQIVNFGENIDANLSPPRQFEKYLLPYYETRAKWIRDSGKFSHIHIDGACKDILPYIADLPFDGIEALTPQPQGDVTIDEIHKYRGNKILLDLIPATLFMPQFPEKRLRDFVQYTLEKFFPKVILGVSDELPGNADGRRLKIVQQIVEDFNANKI